MSSLTPGPLVTSFAVMPLTSFESSIQLRPCSGSSSICRGLTLPATCDDVVSTSGDSLDTVTVSLRLATLSTNAIVAFWPTSSSTDSISTVVNPASSAVSLYLPGGRLSSRNSPRSSLTPIACPPVAMLVAATVAPGSTALVSSVTVPLTVATCAKAGTQSTSEKMNATVPTTFLSDMNSYSSMIEPGAGAGSANAVSLACVPRPVATTTNCRPERA